METTFEQLKDNHAVFTVDVTPAEFAKHVDAAYKKMAPEVSIQGFRKGKVPQAIFEKKYGKESLYQDALDGVISEAYREALETHKDVEPVAYPKVDLETFEPETKIVLKISVATRPEVKLGKYKGIVSEPMSVEVTKDEVKAEITRMLERYSEMEIKEGAAALGDTVVIDYEGFKDDVPFEGGKAENHSLELGSNSFIPGFEDQLVGTKEGEDATVLVTFPEQYHSEDLAGADAVFKVKVHEVKTKVLPEVTEEMIAKLELENVKTEKELEAFVKSSLTDRKAEEAKNEVRTDVLNGLVETTKMALPEEMIDMQVDRMLENFGRQMQSQGFDLPKYYEITGSNEEALRAQMRPDAERQIQESLALEAVIKAEKIEATEEEVNAKLEEMAAMYNMNLEELKMYATNVADDLKMEKAVNFLIENHK